jgi:hypothetical protein
MNITVNSLALKRALDTFSVESKGLDIKVADTKTTSFELVEANRPVLEFLAEYGSVPATQKVKLTHFLFGSLDLNEVILSSTNDLFKKIGHLGGSPNPEFEVKLNGRWYPLMCQIQKFKTMTGDTIVHLNLYGNIGALAYNKGFYFGDWDFEDDDEKPVKKSLLELFDGKDLQLTTPEAVAHCRKQVAKIVQLTSKVNKVHDSHGQGLTYHQWWGWSSMNVGGKDSPSTIIIEPELENQHARYENPADDSWKLPFVRVFSLKHKDYLFVDVEDLHEHVFHKDTKDKIVLPPKMKVALDSVFSASQTTIFGDLFHGRHGGIVVLANGPSGVGKTLTAEVFAEFQERPLYSMEMSEVGTTVQQVEANLQKIFMRAKKWNAVLLFDEADIFLSERVASDLERSAIVGIFLRLLDYYEGTFFLTTNRGEGIDKAFKSRVTLYLNYPDLTPEVRGQIWKHMLKAADIQVTEDSHNTWEDISSVPLNGRQIRNQVRLIKLMHPVNATTTDLRESLEFTAR